MPTDADLAGGARGCRRKTTSDISALLEEAHAAREEEARLDAELAATRREIESVRLSLATVARVSLITTAWAKRARQRAVTLGIVSTEQTARDAALAHQMSFAREPQPEPEPEPEPEPTSEPVHVVPTDSDPRADRTGWPDWALSSERSAARDLVKEPADLGKGDVERGQVEIYENQRRSLLGDFSAKNLLPGTRGAWSDINGAEVERGRLPHGWHWAVEHRQGRTDPEGWEYAFHFRASWFPQPEREGSFGGPAWVRRRKWVPTQSFRAATHVKLASPAADVAAGLRPAQTYQCIFEVWEARSLGFVVNGIPDKDSGNATPPAAVFRIRVGDHWHESAARPQSTNPQWGDQANSMQCRRAFRIATPTDVLAAADEDDDVARLACNFAGVHGVKVRDRIYLPSLTTYQRSFTGKKAVDWLTGVHSRGYHGSGLVATRDEAIELAQEMMDREIFHFATPNAVDGRSSDVRQIFNDSSWAFYRFNEQWLAANTRDSKIMLRKKVLDGLRESMGSVILDPTVACCDELVVELLDAELAATCGPNDDVLPEHLLGSVAIPLRTILQHEASEGWHNLSGPAVQCGEVRIGWLVVEDDGCADHANPSQCPSPKQHLKVREAFAPLKVATSPPSEVTPEMSLQTTAWSELSLFASPVALAGNSAKASACCRMAQSYIDIGDLGSAQTCISAGLGLAGSGDNGDLLEMQEQLAKWCSTAKVDRTWTPLFQRHASGGNYRFSQFTRYDRKTPWITWHGTPHVDGGFCDELGFVVPPGSAHEWRMANSYSLCIAARHRAQWETLIFTRGTTGWMPGTADAEAVADLVMHHGVPPELRRVVWPALLGATVRRQQAVRGGHANMYPCLVERYMEAGEHRTQIRKDIKRTLPGQCTVVNTDEGVQCLERILGAFSEYDKWYGYTQSLNMVAAHLLVVMSLEAEEEVFWMLAQIVEVVVPEYYTSRLYGVQADAVVLSTLTEHWVGSAHTSLVHAGVPMTLVASRWLMPLYAETLQPYTLHRLWDVVFLTRSATPLHAAALTILRGAHADSFWDFEAGCPSFEGAMQVLTKGASGAYDAQPFLEHVTSYMSLLSEREIGALHYDCLVNGCAVELSARLPGFDQAMNAAQNSLGYEWEKIEIKLDRWQVFRLAMPFAEQLEYEAQTSGDDCVGLTDESDASSLSISVAGACHALGTLMPGLRQHSDLLELFVQRVLVTGTRLPDEQGHKNELPGRVTLACWLNTVIALQPQANDSPARCSLWWRFCGGGGPGGRIRDGANGAMIHEVVAVICTVYAALGTAPDDHPRFPTAEAVKTAVTAHYTERDRSWVKRSATKHGLGRRSTAQLIATQHGIVFEALVWDSPLCLGVPIPSRKPPSRSVWSLSG